MSDFVGGEFVVPDFIVKEFGNIIKMGQLTPEQRAERAERERQRRAALTHRQKIHEWRIRRNLTITHGRYKLSRWIDPYPEHECDDGW